MSPLQTDDSDRWVKIIEDTIADSSKVREGLHDDEAIPLIDWGAEQAGQIAARMAVPDTPEPDQETVEETAYALVRLMTRITWVATYRHKKDAAWLTRTFNTINKLSEQLYGPDAPVLSEDEIATWIAEHENYSNGELVQKLIARLTPVPASDTPETTGGTDSPAVPDSPGPVDLSSTEGDSTNE